MRTYPEERIWGPGCWFSLALAVCIVWFLLFTKAYFTVLSAALNLSELFGFACLKHFQDIILCSVPA